MRRPVPFGPGAPYGALFDGEGRSCPINLWDLSEDGLCVVTTEPLTFRPGELMVLELHSGVGVQFLRLQVHLIWAASEEGGFGTFVGLQFQDGDQLPNGSFLDRFLTMELPD